MSVPKCSRNVAGFWDCGGTYNADRMSREHQCSQEILKKMGLGGSGALL